MAKHNREPSPDIYRIRFKPGRWRTKAERFFSAFSAGEALDALFHAFETGKVDANCITVYSVEMWDRFAEKWICSRIDAIKSSKLGSPEMSLKGKTIYICNEKAR